MFRFTGHIPSPRPQGHTIGILAAAELVSPPHTPVLAPEAEAPDGVAVLAVAEPGQTTALAWTGDPRAYGWDGSRLRQLTTDHTIGEYLRLNGDGGPIELLAAAHDNWLRTSLATPPSPPSTLARPPPPS